MSAGPSTSTSNSNLASIFNAALKSYKRKTKKDLTSHPLIPSLRSCDSPEAILNVLRDQISTSNQSQNDDNRFTKWVTPTVNVLYAFSATIGQGVGLAFPPANAIFAGIGVLLMAAKDASTSQERIIEVFNRIERFFRRLETYTALTPTAAMTDMIVEIMVEVLTILAVTTKEVKCGPLKRYLRKLLGNRDIEDSLDRLDKLTQEETRMATAELLNMTHRVHDRVEGVEDKITGNQLRDSLLRWLCPPDPYKNYNIARKAYHDGTAEWFLQGSIFSQWKSTGSFLWIHGKPGSGKSVLCSSIVHDILALSDARMASMAHFYFDFRDINKQKLHNLLPSLLIQLSARSDPCCRILSQLHSAHDRGIRDPSDRAMVECLKEMLSLEAQPPIYIILDALDECPLTSAVPSPPSPREEVLEFVNDLVALHLPNLHIIVTSRPEHDIRVVLERLTEHPVSLHDESGQQEDITNYITTFVRSNLKTGNWLDEQKDLVIKTLSEKAGGMFRWAYCQLELLRHCFPSSVRYVLEELPETLDETYERILKEIRKPNQGHALRLLQCLVAAVRPLEVQELSEVLAFDFNTEGIPNLYPGWRWEDQEGAVMLACSGLVMIVEDPVEYDSLVTRRVVQFSHFSVKEFLTADRLAEPIRPVSRYHIRLEDAHTTLARACLGVLLHQGDRIDRDSVGNFPLARYAAQHWATHARIENVSSRIMDGMKRLFDADKPHFATWVWLYSEYRRGTTGPEEPKAVPLYYAAMLGLRDLAEHLIAKNPGHVNARGGPEETPLHVAASAGHSDILSLLVDHGADVNAQGLRGDTPLRRASNKGVLEVGQVLLDRGADVNAETMGGSAPLVGAAFNGHVEFVRMLLDRGAILDTRTMWGMTALHFAASSGHTEVVRLLLERGADAGVRDKEHKTPSDLGSQYHEIVNLLSDYNASSAQK